MSNKKDTSVYQLDNGYWAYRYKINIDGVVKEKRRRTDELGNPFKTKASAARARQKAIVNEKVNAAVPHEKRPVMFIMSIVSSVEQEKPMPLSRSRTAFGITISKLNSVNAM